MKDIRTLKDNCKCRKKNQAEGELCRGGSQLRLVGGAEGERVALIFTYGFYEFYKPLVAGGCRIGYYSPRSFSVWAEGVDWQRERLFGKERGENGD